MDRFVVKMACAGFLSGLLLLTGCGKKEFSLPESLKNADKEKGIYFAEKSVSFGDRYSGSENIRKYGDWIIKELKKFPGMEVEEEVFSCDTPTGNISFRNIIGKISGKSQDHVIVGAHYDTKRCSTFPFAGANDGASGTAALLLIADTLGKIQEKLPYTLHLVFFDGEECQEDYGENDGLHGSKYHAANLHKRKGKCKGMILLDMVGDKELCITPPKNSHSSLVALFEKAVESMDKNSLKGRYNGAILDDHVPFLEKNIPAVDLIDFSYGENNVYWHSPEDTMDKISGESIAFASDVTIRMLYNMKNTGL